MTLKTSLASIEALYRKLERELYRSYHERNNIRKADHFYNFCITAQSLRDYFFERKGILEDSKKQPYNDLWGKNDLLVAVSEIANTAKHFTLRDFQKNPKIQKTKRVRNKKSGFIDIYTNGEGDIFFKKSIATDYVVTTRSGATYDLYFFTKSVLDFWYSFLRNENIPVRRQSLKRLIG